jgi:hypothetical protein
MTATLSRIVLDRFGEPQMIVHPDFDSQLTDPKNAEAFAPAGTTQVDVPRFFSTPLTRRAVLVIIQAKLAENNHPLLASIVQARIDLMDAVDQWRSDVDARDVLIEKWPSPTQIQQTLINAATVKAFNSGQTAQDKRDALAALVAQLP